MRISRSAAPLFLAALVTAGLAGCATEAAPAATPSAAAEAPAETTETATATAEPSAEPEETEAAAAPAGDTVTPAWALPTTSPGELLTSVDGSNFRVDIYQVGTAPASTTGSFVDADTNTPLIEVGDEIVYLNYVMTNTSSEPIKLTALVVDVIPRYADWAYMAGMDGIVDRAVTEQMNVNYSAIGTTGAEAPYAWAPDETFSYSDNFEYQPGSVINFTIGLTPSDDAGDLLHDQKEALEVASTIK